MTAKRSQPLAASVLYPISWNTWNTLSCVMLGKKSLISRFRLWLYPIWFFALVQIEWFFKKPSQHSATEIWYKIWSKTHRCLIFKLLLGADILLVFPLFPVIVNSWQKSGSIFSILSTRYKWYPSNITGKFLLNRLAAYSAHTLIYSCVYFLESSYVNFLFHVFSKIERLPHKINLIQNTM